ncbi:MAG: hypothetical protein ACLSVX_01985 [Massilimicrobiota timonensis]
MMIVMSQFWKYDEYEPYFAKRYDEFDFIYNKEKEPVGISIQDDVEYIYFLKERNSKAYMNNYNKKQYEYNWKYEGYDCEVEVLSSISLWKYGNKSIYVFIKTDDFWIRRYVDCSDIQNSSDFKNIKRIQDITNPYIKKMINIYEKYHLIIREAYQKGCEELKLDKDDKI